MGLLFCAFAIERIHPDSDLLAKVPNPPALTPMVGADTESGLPGASEQLRLAILGEEHAWLKTYGYADIEKRLRITPYPERKFAKHSDDDLLPLPLLRTAPKLNGQPDDPAWQAASRGVMP